MSDSLARTFTAAPRERPIWKRRSSGQAKAYSTALNRRGVLALSRYTLCRRVSGPLNACGDLLPCFFRQAARHAQQGAKAIHPGKGRPMPESWAASCICASMAGNQRPPAPRGRCSTAARTRIQVSRPPGMRERPSPPRCPAHVARSLGGQAGAASCLGRSGQARTAARARLTPRRRAGRQLHRTAC